MPRILKVAAHTAEVDWMIGSMEIKLQRAKEKNPNGDFKEPEKKVEIIKSLRDEYILVEAENFILDKKIREEFSSNQSLRLLIENYVQEIKELELKLKTSEYFK